MSIVIFHGLGKIRKFTEWLAGSSVWINSKRLAMLINGFFCNKQCDSRSGDSIMAMISRVLGYATLLGTMSVHATNYYVDSSLGADTNSGSETTPWKSLAKVNSAKLLPGDTVFF